MSDEKGMQPRNWKGVRWIDSIKARNLAEEIALHFAHDCNDSMCGEDADASNCEVAWIEDKLSDFLDTQASLLPQGPSGTTEGPQHVVGDRISNKGTCSGCGKPIIVEAGRDCWHSKDDKVWHETCSYRNLVEQYHAQNKELIEQVEALKAERAVAMNSEAPEKPIAPST